jgi:hypothetical protein
VLAAFLRALDVGRDGEEGAEVHDRSPEPAAPEAVVAQPA